MLLHAEQYASGDNLSAGNTLIILHGLFGNYRNWQPVARSLAKQQVVYSLDLRNHGQSAHSEIMSYPEMAEDIFTFIQHKQLASVDIIAHSMGGKAAMYLALSHPELVDKLVIVDIAPVSYEHDFSIVLDAFKSVPLDTIQSRQDADLYLSKTLSERHLRQFLLQNLQFKEEKYRWRLNIDGIRRNIRTLMSFPDTRDYKPFSKRVLFVGGGQSDYLTKEHQKQTKQLFPLASFSIIKSAGHWLHVEQRELFQALIKPYLYQ